MENMENHGFRMWRPGGILLLPTNGHGRELYCILARAGGMIHHLG